MTLEALGPIGTPALVTIGLIVAVGVVAYFALRNVRPVSPPVSEFRGYSVEIKTDYAVPPLAETPEHVEPPQAIAEPIDTAMEHAAEALTLPDALQVATNVIMQPLLGCPCPNCQVEPKPKKSKPKSKSVKKKATKKKRK